MADLGLYHPRERNCGSTTSDAGHALDSKRQVKHGCSARPRSLLAGLWCQHLCVRGTMVFVNAVAGGKPNASEYVFIAFCTAVPWVIGRALRYILAGE